MTLVRFALVATMLSACGGAVEPAALGTTLPQDASATTDSGGWGLNDRQAVLTPDTWHEASDDANVCQCPGGAAWSCGTVGPCYCNGLCPPACVCVGGALWMCGGVPSGTCPAPDAGTD